METIGKIYAALLGAAVSFLTGFPPLVLILIGVMSIDYITGLMCGAVGKSAKTESGKLSSREAFYGLMRKALVLLVVLLATLLDMAVSMYGGFTFSAVTGAVCLWFIASEGISILENVVAFDLPVPGVLVQLLELMQAEGGRKTEKNDTKE